MLVDLQLALDGKAAVPDAELFQKWANAVATQLLGDADNSGCCIRVIDADEMQQLNRQFRGKDKPTNVLSFPLPASVEDGLTWLGDILICAPVVASEAAEQGKSETAHWAHMTVHGLLHLLDYDHEKDKDAEEMERLEVATLSGLGFANPYEPEATASQSRS